MGPDQIGGDGQVVENGGQRRSHFRRADESMIALEKIIIKKKTAVRREFKFTIKKNNYLNIFKR